METNTETDKTFAPSINEESKKIAIISYITIIGLVIAFVMNNDKKLSFASYHIRQSLGLAATSLSLFIIGMVPILGWIINIFGFFVLLYMWVMGLMNAINEREKSVPILGKKFETWFDNVFR